jgi:hypothetical protein
MKEAVSTESFGYTSHKSRETRGGSKKNEKGDEIYVQRWGKQGIIKVPQISFVRIPIPRDEYQIKAREFFFSFLH